MAKANIKSIAQSLADWKIKKPRRNSLADFKRYVYGLVYLKEELGNDGWQKVSSAGAGHTLGYGIGQGIDDSTEAKKLIGIFANEYSRPEISENRLQTVVDVVGLSAFDVNITVNDVRDEFRKQRFGHGNQWDTLSVLAKFLMKHKEVRCIETDTRKQVVSVQQYRELLGTYHEIFGYNINIMLQETPCLFIQEVEPYISSIKGEAKEKECLELCQRIIRQSYRCQGVLNNIDEGLLAFVRIIKALLCEFDGKNINPVVVRQIIERILYVDEYDYTIFNRSFVDKITLIDDKTVVTKLISAMVNEVCEDFPEFEIERLVNCWISCDEFISTCKSYNYNTARIKR